MKRKKLIDARINSKKTQLDLSDEVGISISMYAQIEQGRRNPSDEVKERIANALGVNVGYLFFGEPITISDKAEEVN